MYDSLRHQIHITKSQGTKTYTTYYIHDTTACIAASMVEYRSREYIVYKISPQKIICLNEKQARKASKTTAAAAAARASSNQRRDSMA